MPSLRIGGRLFTGTIVTAEQQIKPLLLCGPAALCDGNSTAT